MSTVEKWGWASVVATFGAGLGLGALLFVALNGLDSGQNQAIAAWVQAIGSIGAIFGAALIAIHQTNAARNLAQRLEEERLRRRWSSVKGVVDALYQQCLDVSVEFQERERFGFLAFALTYDARSFSRALQRVEAIPLFDLDSDVLVTAVTSLKDSAEWLQRWADSGKEHAHPGFKPKEDEPQDWQIIQMGKSQMERVTHFYRMVQSVTGGMLLTEPLPFNERLR